jgi:hypothetical protein
MPQPDPPPPPKPLMPHVKLPAKVQTDGTRWIILHATEHVGGPIMWDLPDQLQVIDMSAIYPNANLTGAKGVVLDVLPDAPAGDYLVQAWCAKNDAASLLTKCVIEYRPKHGPRPEPGPGPGPNPDPSPGPVTPQKLAIVIVEETADAVADRGNLFRSPQLAARMKEKGHVWRVVDKDVVGPDGGPPADVARFIADAKTKTLPQVYLVDMRGRTVVQGPLTNPAAPSLLALITKAGG